uniref:Uncharacterized protein n=1 Tax=viral metagenome TaxID=1070528 RepID=A0A6C0D7P4_9ZZZZ
MNKTRKNSNSQKRIASFAVKNPKKACEEGLKSKKLKEDMKKKGININTLKKDKSFKKTFFKECISQLKQLKPLLKLLKTRKN